jgi:hypothetical protein
VHPPVRPSISDVYSFLRSRNALIVHFSGAPKGAGRERGSRHLFPRDLEHVIAGNASGGVSCSVIEPGDKFGQFERNATGCIGLVLGLTAPESLVAVHSEDCGSFENSCGVRVVPVEQDVAISDLKNSLVSRKSYNEWVLRDFVVLGLFAAPPYEVSVLETPKWPADMPDYLRDETPVPSFKSISLRELEEFFPNLPIYGFGGAQLVRQSARGATEIPHTAVYTDQ